MPPAAQPRAACYVVPHRAGASAPGLVESVVGEAGDGVVRWPSAGVVHEKRGRGVGEVGSRADGGPGHVYAAADGR
jgi:hypothetical protein